MLPFRNISGLRISLASPEQIHLWSSGEVTKAETINYRTLKPERDGLFCERIFGPAKDWTCACGKYKRPRYKDHVCENCGVTISPARSRRMRMGHIELAAPVSHVWFARGMPSRIGLLLDLSPRELDRILSFTHYIVTHVEEKLRLSEVQRVKAEIARVAAMPGDFYTIGPLDEQPSEQDAGEGEEDEENEENGDVEGDDECEQETLYISKQERVRQLQQVLKQLTELRCYKLLEIEEYRLLREECDEVFQAGIGAEVIQDMLGEIDLDRLARSLRREFYEKDGSSRSKAMKRLKIVEALRGAHINPQWMILNTIPVLPPDLRPVLALDGGRFAASDVNELYCRVIHRNNRLKRFMENGAPEIIIFHEKRALQEACDALFDNAHCRRPLVGANRKPLHSLSDTLRGKGGRFRHNLLGKRVDYSGRSVISVGLDLKLYQCGLPKKIALELFKPFIINKLIAYDYVQTPRQAKKAVERRHPEVWDVLDEVMRDRLVLLNRAPTLHRLSIQAFVPILVEGSAIRLHPQVCSPFNADFDGDQMAVHLPLSSEAQKEARELMLSTRNLLSPASGEPTISISQEMVLGCYYLTQERPDKKGEGRIFSDSDEAVMAYAHGVIDLQARISVRMVVEAIYHQPSPVPPVPHIKGKRLDTTVGRILFNAVLPKRLRFKNYAMKKEYLKQILWECIKEYGLERTAIMADAIKRLGFSNATKAGISFAISDVTVPSEKKQLLADAGVMAQELRDSWSAGLITRDELYQQTIAVWQKTTDQIAQHVQEVLDPYGSVATISSSGATKAKLQQIRQLSGMRGLMASPSGAIIETPVRGNFLEGLTVAEYFLSSHGARKSLMDRSLNTAEAGYLTIRLVNVAQDVIVTEEDCGTHDGLLITDDDNKKMGLSDGRTRLFGRVLAEALPQVGLSAGDELYEEVVERILAARIPVVRVRSVFACQAKHGVCRICYGWDLSKRALVNLGTAVGIIAAQSIGEPGTQLTMRTFHSGGIAGGQGDITQGLPRVEELFEGRVPREQATTTEIEGVVTITKDEESGRQSVEVVAATSILDEYPLPHGCLIVLNNANDSRVVAQGDVIAALPAGRAEEERLIRARLAGTLCIGADGVLTIRAEEQSTRSYTIPRGRSLIVSDGQHVQAGEPLTSGALNLEEMLRRRGRAELELYLLREAQAVYRTTGAYVHDKHFEIIIRQMLRYAQVEHPGDTDLLPEDLVDRFTCADMNAHILAQGGEPAVIRSVLLGLTRATLATKSWLAAASFQQTSRILTDAALAGQTDYLVGLKENVILGKLIPAGTGILPRAIPRQPTRLQGAGRGRKKKNAS